MRDIYTHLHSQDVRGDSSRKASHKRQSPERGGGGSWRSGPGPDRDFRGDRDRGGPRDDDRRGGPPRDDDRDRRPPPRERPADDGPSDWRRGPRPGPRDDDRRGGGPPPPRDEERRPPPRDRPAGDQQDDGWTSVKGKR